MAAGDEEYREPNRLLRTVIASVIAVVLILSIGTYFLVREYRYNPTLELAMKIARLRKLHKVKIPRVARQASIRGRRLSSAMIPFASRKYRLRRPAYAFHFDASLCIVSFPSRIPLSSPP